MHEGNSRKKSLLAGAVQHRTNVLMYVYSVSFYKTHDIVPMHYLLMYDFFEFKYLLYICGDLQAGSKAPSDRQLVTVG